MWIESGVPVFLTFLWLTNASNPEERSGSITNVNRAVCNETMIKDLDECGNKLSRFKNQGIPSDPRTIENSCRMFDAGIQCVENWTKTCLSPENQEKAIGSFVGAVQTYRYLCSDLKFREEFLKHASCYNRISLHWDDCTRKFINTLMKVDHANDVLSLCCIRFRYTECITDGAKSFCSRNATKFLEKLATSLMQSTLQDYHSSRCIGLSKKNCTSAHVSSAQASCRDFSNSLLYIIHGIILVLTSQQMLHYFIIMLQRSAFSYFFNIILFYLEIKSSYTISALGVGFHRLSLALQGLLGAFEHGASMFP